MSHIKFFNSFIKKPGESGAIMPSSKFLANTITSSIGLEHAKSIVELGPGTGVFTKTIIEKMGKDAHFFAVERNDDIYEHFIEAYPKVKAYNLCASELLKMMSEEGIDKLDIVLSGLPWAAFPQDVQSMIMDSVVEALKDGGVFTTFAYLQGFMLPAAHRFKALLKDKFSSVQTSKIVWRNAPPAFVYRCRK